MKTKLSAYLGFATNGIQEMYAYRLRMLIWVLYDFSVLFVQYFLWRAIFAGANGVMHGISLEQYLAYVAFGLVFGRLIDTGMDGDMAQEIKNGNIAMHLIKPYSYFLMLSARRMGQTVGAAFALLPVLTVTIALVGLPQTQLFVALTTLVSVILAYVLLTIITFLLGLVAFWLTNYWGLFLFKQHIIALFSGQLISLNLVFLIGTQGMDNLPLPGIDGPTLSGLFRILGWISYALPFQATSYTPTGIFTGMISGTGPILLHLGIQLGWIIALGALASWTWARAQRRITILGG